MIPAVMAHQFEEYIRPGGFRAWYNLHVLGSANAEEPLGTRLAVIINIPIAWGLLLAAALVGRDFLWFTLSVNGLFFVNAWLHIARSFGKHEHVPGTTTATLLLLPLTSYTYHYYIMTWDVPYSMFVGTLLIGSVCHMIMTAALMHRLTQDRQKAS
jgi:hypothetical protein